MKKLIIQKILLLSLLGLPLLSSAFIGESAISDAGFPRNTKLRRLLSNSIINSFDDQTRDIIYNDLSSQGKEITQRSLEKFKEIPNFQARTDILQDIKAIATTIDGIPKIDSHLLTQCIRWGAEIIDLSPTDNKAGCINQILDFCAEFLVDGSLETHILFLQQSFELFNPLDSNEDGHINNIIVSFRSQLKGTYDLEKRLDLLQSIITKSNNNNP